MRTLIASFILLLAPFAGSAQESQSTDVVYLDGTFDSFTEVLEEFRGKVILLDFWATWCKPCIQEFPHYDRLNEYLDEEPEIVLVFISLDGNREQKWRNFVDDRQIRGYHYLASRPVHFELLDEWGISSIPRYMIVDKSGEIAVSHAPRPSQGKALIRRLQRVLEDG